MSPLRIGIIGAGYWGDKLKRVFGARQGAQVRAICDRDPRCLAAQPPAIATTTEIAALLVRNDIDAVLAAGKHCWVEKPLAMHAAEARELVALAEQQKRTLFVDETFLYDPLVQTAKLWIDSGRLGQLYHLSFERLGQGRIRRDSNVWWNSAPHDLSLLCYLAPGKVESVRAEGFAYV